MTKIDPDLNSALLEAEKRQKLLDKLTWGGALFFALFVSVVAANHNIWSLLATFIVASMLFVLASIYRISLGWLLAAIAGFCLLDNYLSHQQQFHQQHFLMQFATLLIFTAIFGLSRPYLYKLLNGLSHKNDL